MVRYCTIKDMQKFLKKQRGFTLIELLVVIAIMGVLAAVGLGAYMSAQTKARDAKRKSDLQSIARALELYYNDYKKYPGGVNGVINGCGTGGTQACTDDFIADGTEYMLELPTDPKGTYYYEVSGAGVGYKLYTRLENTQDKVVVQFGTAAGAYGGTTCRASAPTKCNYGIASSNLTMPAGVAD